MKRYEFTRWSGATDHVDAERVEFTPGAGLAFWTGDRLVLAVKPGNWDRLTEIETSAHERHCHALQYGASSLPTGYRCELRAPHYGPHRASDGIEWE